MRFPDVDGLLPLPPFLRYSSCCRLTQWVSGGRSAHSAAAAAAVSYQGAPAIKSAGPSDPSAPAMAGEFWINLFGSCVMEQEPQPNRCQHIKILFWPINWSTDSQLVLARQILTDSPSPCCSGSVQRSAGT